MGASEQKDAPLECPFGVSEQKDTSLETILRASEQKDAPLETILRVSEHQPLLLDTPTRAPERQPLLLENILVANGWRWPIKWFPTEANGRRAHVLENISGANERQRPFSDVRVGAQKHTPPISGPRTIAPIGYPPQSENISGANERHRPLSDVRVGAYCIRPRCSGPRTIAPDRYPPQSENISGADGRRPPPLDLSPAGAFDGAYAIRPYPTGGWDAMAHKMVSDGGERTSGAAVGRPCRGVLHTPPMFMAENNSARQVSAAIGFHFIGGWASTAAVGFVPCGAI